jgi:flagellar assembly factor FliW
LKAPLIFNLKNRRGKQIILNNTEYTTRHNIMEEVRKRTNEVDEAAVQQVIEKAKDAKEAVQNQTPAAEQGGGD